MNCRHCESPLSHVYVDLGSSPPCNAMLREEDLGRPEAQYPLRALVCGSCFLVQSNMAARPEEIFNRDYTYFSSYSRYWLAHAEEYAEMISERLGLGANSLVVEVASNDGYLLQYLLAKGIPSVGVEPSSGTAAVAIERGIPTWVEFFSSTFVQEFLLPKYGPADLLIGNNVFAHVPDCNDFAAALKLMLAERGTITLEFPHLLHLIKDRQFDTIYHEHYFYLSLSSARRILNKAGLEVFEVEELPTHGGSLRLYAGHAEEWPASGPTVEALLEKEHAFGLDRLETYAGFQSKAEHIRDTLLRLLTDLRASGKTVIGYGAAGKGNTLLNFCGIEGTDLLRFVADASPHKQGLYLPGSHIPVVSEREIRRLKPDFILILPWNLEQEIRRQLDYVRKWGCKFVIAIPEVRILDET